MKKISPISYVLEIRINSMKNNCVAQIETSTPFGNISIGDKFYHESLSNEAWHDLPDYGQVFFVKDKAHIMSIHHEKILHVIIICLEARSVI